MGSSEEKKKVAKVSKAAVTKMTIMQLIERVVAVSTGSRFSDESMKECAPFLKALAKRLEMSEMEALFLAVFVDNSHDSSIEYRDLSRHFGCSNIKIMCYNEELKSLLSKGYIFRGSGKSLSYGIAKSVVETLADNRAYEKRSIKGLNIYELFEVMGSYFEAKNKEEVTTVELAQNLYTLVSENSELPFVKAVEKYAKYEPHDCEWSFVLMLFMCSQLINDDDDSVVFSEISRIIDSKRDFNVVKRAMRIRVHSLMREGIIEEKRSDGLFSRDSYCLTEMVKSEILKDFEIEDGPVEPKAKFMISHESLAEKSLFYNDKERGQIEQLSALLTQENFLSVQSRLEQRSLRKGFAALFYGAPGTGKTESVYQIARQTGRDIVEVNVSQIKSMWVGESEKNIKSTFDRYRKMCESNEKMPILLFNEADVILGVRREGGGSAVDKMENSIQNIILQEMEDLDGIMIATTNLTKNLDSAFERRFLYKIEFGKPSLEARQSIWLSMMPSLEAEDAMQLAKRYDFSGGQIENIARKQSVELIISGKEPSMEMLREYCDAEIIGGTEQRRRVGF